MNDHWNPYSYDLDDLRRMFPDGFPDTPIATAFPGMPNAAAPMPSTPVPALSTFFPRLAPSLRGPALRDPYEFGGVVTGLPVLGLDDDPELDRIVGPPPKPISSYLPAWMRAAQWTGLSPLAGSPSVTAPAPASSPVVAHSLPPELSWAEGAQHYGAGRARQMERLPNEPWYQARVEEMARQRQAEDAWRRTPDQPREAPRHQNSAENWGAQNRPGEPWPDPWMHPGRYDRLPHQEGAGAFGSIPPHLQQEATEFANTPYLAPISRGPDWDKVVVKNPLPQTAWWPSATSWGQNVDAGIECFSADGRATCTTPGGSRFTVRVPSNFPAYVGRNHPDYHYYDTPVRGPLVDQERLMQEIIKNPTPGPSDLVRPATPEGTLNEATPPEVYYPWHGYVNMDPPSYALLPHNLRQNQVRSFLTRDQNGRMMVVNVTERGHGLEPGIVVRYITPSASGLTIQNEGAGLGWVQAPETYRFLPDRMAPIVLDEIASVWRPHSSEHFRRADRDRVGGGGGW